MPFLRLLLAAWLGLLPGVAAAQTAVRAVVAPATAGMPISPTVAPLAAPAPSPAAPLALFSGLSGLASPGSARPAPPSAAPATAGATSSAGAGAALAAGSLAARHAGSAAPAAASRRLAVAKRAAALSSAIAKEAARSARGPADASRASTDRQFSWVTGETFRGLPTQADAPSAAEPGRGPLARLLAPRIAEPRPLAAALEPPQPAVAPTPSGSVRWMQAGTAFWKLGLDPVTVAIPLLALATGGAVTVAWLAILYGTAQMAATSLASGLTDRHPASRVLWVAALAQAGLVTSILALSAAGLLAPALLFPMYAALGAATGVLETARRVVPALVLGTNEDALKRYNGRLHIFYEIAGVSGAFVAGALILRSGPLAALWLQPPAALLAAWAFSRVRHAFTAAPAAKSAGRRGALLSGPRNALNDLREGARTVLGDKRLRWLAIVMVLPAVVHRVFENVLLPVFSKSALQMPAASAWLLAASNLGELAGAALLLRLATRTKGPFAWLKLAAAGLLGAWALSTATSLSVLMPIILVFSATWAASDLSLLSFLQSRVSLHAQPRALGFLVGLTTLVSTVAALTFGKWLDLVGPGLGFIGVNVAVTALAVAVAWASTRLKK